MGKFLIIVMVVVVILFGGIAFFTQKPTSTNSDITAQLNAAKTPAPSNSVNTQTPSTIPSPTLSADCVSTLSALAVHSAEATIHTAKGNINLVLYPQDAPYTVKNFATLSKCGFYNGLTFHRVVPGFVIQGGDPNGNGTGGTSIYGPTFADELNASSSSYIEGYKEGVLAMANRGPNTNSSQFFIMLADNPTLPKNYTIFGKVTSGMDVVKNIAVGDKINSIEVK